MYGYAALSLVLFYVFSTAWSWRHNYMTLKRSGLNVVVAPVYIGAPVWMALSKVFIPLFKLLPTAWTKTWIDILSPSWAYESTTKPFERQGDIIMVASPGGKYMTTNNAEVISQICTRRADFQKPVLAYKVIELFGQNVLSSEGSTWRAHRKATAPAFSEELHGLVWMETVEQTIKMVKVWQGRGTNSPDKMRVPDLGQDTISLTLHIISKAGFGVPLVWPDQQDDAAATTELAEFSSQDPPQGHDLTFRLALEGSVTNILWFAVFSPRVLGALPFQAPRKAWQAWANFDLYLKELLERKRSTVSSGTSKDLMARLVDASATDGAESTKNSGVDTGGLLKSSDITGNTFVFLVAGHETTAISILYSCLFLAIHRDAQRRLQEDIDDILQDMPVEKTDYEGFYDRFANSMVGAVINEQLRLLPPVVLIPKLVVTGNQTVTADGRTVLVPDGTFIHIPTIALHRNPRYWPNKPSARTHKSHDLDDFRPSRWILEDANTPDRSQAPQPGRRTQALYSPPHGSFVPFSEGQRGCLGRRFALVEMTAALVSIFRQYSVELAVDEWASDEEVERMSDHQRSVLYKKAADMAYHKLETGASARLTLQLDKGNEIPVRFVRRGMETPGFNE